MASGFGQDFGSLLGRNQDAMAYTGFSDATGQQRRQEAELAADTIQGMSEIRAAKTRAELFKQQQKQQQRAQSGAATGNLIGAIGGAAVTGVVGALV